MQAQRRTGSFGQRKQLIEDHTKTIAAALNLDEDGAFMRYVYAVLFNTRYDDPGIDDDIVDGGGDKQFDIVRVVRDDDHASIWLVQVKNSANRQLTQTSGRCGSSHTGRAVSF